MSKGISRFRTAAFVRQNGLCYYCNLPMWLNDPASFAVRFGIKSAQAGILRCTAEHLHPLSEGGQNSASNIVAACLFCNTRRHRRKIARAPEEHRKHVQRHMLKRRWHGLDIPLPQCLDFEPYAGVHPPLC